MSELKAPSARNDLAHKLLDRLEDLGACALGGFHGGKQYCIAVKVNNPVEATKLGMALGDGRGEVGCDTWPNGRNFVVFRDALAQA